MFECTNLRLICSTRPSGFYGTILRVRASYLENCLQPRHGHDLVSGNQTFWAYWTYLGICWVIQVHVSGMFQRVSPHLHPKRRVILHFTPIRIDTYGLVSFYSNLCWSIYNLPLLLDLKDVVPSFLQLVLFAQTCSFQKMSCLELRCSDRSCYCSSQSVAFQLDLLHRLSESYCCLQSSTYRLNLFSPLLLAEQTTMKTFYLFKSRFNKHSY